jgi:hypothetical protein
MKLRYLFMMLALCLPAAAQKTFTSVEQMSGWQGCSDCAQGSVTTTFSLKQAQTSPSMDGKSAKFAIGGSTPWGLALWHKFMGYYDTAKNFTMDVWLYGDKPMLSNGYEFGLSQAVGGKWYKWSIQFSFNKKIVSVWDSYNRRWVATSMPAITPSAYKWHHYVFTLQKTSTGKAAFLTFNVDGQNYYINKSFSPQPTSNHGISTHFQLNQNGIADDYSLWLDKYTISFS